VANAPSFSTFLNKSSGKCHHAHFAEFGVRADRDADDPKFRIEDILSMSLLGHAIIDDERDHNLPRLY